MSCQSAAQSAPGPHLQRAAGGREERQRHIIARDHRQLRGRGGWWCVRCGASVWRCGAGSAARRRTARCAAHRAAIAAHMPPHRGSWPAQALPINIRSPTCTTRRASVGAGSRGGRGRGQIAAALHQGHTGACRPPHSQRVTHHGALVRRSAAPHCPLGAGGLRRSWTASLGSCSCLRLDMLIPGPCTNTSELRNTLSEAIQAQASFKRRASRFRPSQRPRSSSRHTKGFSAPWRGGRRRGHARRRGAPAMQRRRRRRCARSRPPLPRATSPSSASGARQSTQRCATG